MMGEHCPCVDVSSTRRTESKCMETVEDLLNRAPLQPCISIPCLGARIRQSTYALHCTACPGAMMPLRQRSGEGSCRVVAGGSRSIL